MSIKIAGSTALVTGSNQGIGKGFVEVLLARDAKHIYATARRPETLDEIVALDLKRVTALTLDVTNHDHRTAAANTASDINLLINNAGIPGSSIVEERRFLGASTMDDARHVMETDYFAQVEMCRLFAPHIVAKGGGAIVNILSIGSLFCLPEYATYCAAKAAAAIMTIGIRTELAHDNVLVSGVFTAGVDTRMSAKNDRPKMSPVEHAHEVFDAVEAGVEDIFAGTGASDIRDAILADTKAFEQQHTERFYSSPLP